MSTPDSSVSEPSVILLDVEGTTTSISFVKEILFPFSVDNLKAFLRAEWFDPETQRIIAQLRSEASEIEDIPKIPEGDDEHDVSEGVYECVRLLVLRDMKLTTLKELQGRIWRKGFESGVIKGHLFPDVPGKLKSWKEEGKLIYIYSSGSEEAQKLLFNHSEAGDLLPLIDGHFDTRVGNKRDPESYRRILVLMKKSPEEVLFLTDVEEEADAARKAGMKVGVLKRPGNAQFSRTDFPVFESFDEIPVQL